MRHTQYPNPDAVKYASVQPPGFPCQLTTQNPGRMYPVHNHGAWLNKEGTGNTDLASGHYHVVRNFKVQPDPSDGHTHDLTMLACGVGAPRGTGRDGPMAVHMGALSPQELEAVQRQNTLLADRARMMRRVLWFGLGALVLTGAVVGGIAYYRSQA
jgi:hypothetical protein